MTTERQKLFVRMMTPLFHAQQSVADLFFKNRLNKEIEHAIDKHIQHQASPSKESRDEYIRALKDLYKVLQEIIYLEKGDAIQLAFSQEQVLRCLYDFLQDARTIKQTPTKTEAVVSTRGGPASGWNAEPAPRPVISASESVVQKSFRNKGKLTETQNNILEFVRREPDCRTKDVIGQFSALSQRTIKRGLKELNEGGWIIKRSDGVAVYYSAV